MSQGYNPSPGGGGGGVTDHTLLTSIGVNTHAQIDTALTRLANTSGINTGDNAPNANTGLVHTSGNETIAGLKTFTGGVDSANLLSANGLQVYTNNLMLSLAGIEDNYQSLLLKPIDVIGGVNYFGITSGVTGTGPTFSAAGPAANIDFLITSKGTGKVRINGSEVSGINTGDNAANTNYANDYRAANFVAGTNYLAPNGSAALLTSFPTLNQSTTGNAATATVLQTARTINGVSFDGSANITIADSTKEPSFSILSIAKGGTNASSYNPSVGGIFPLLYWDDVQGKFVTDPIPSHLGYSATTDTFYSGAIIISGATTNTAQFKNTGVQGATGGAGMSGFATPGASITLGSRLGYYLLGGETIAGTTSNSAGVSAFATENWTATAAGSRLDFETTANGGLVRSTQMSILGNGLVGIGLTNPTHKLEITGVGQLTSALTDAGDKTNTLFLSSTSTTAGAGGALVFGNTQTAAAGAEGFAAIKGLLTSGAGTTTGALAFSTRNATTDTALTERARFHAIGGFSIGTAGRNGDSLTTSASNTTGSGTTYGEYTIYSTTVASTGVHVGKYIINTGNPGAGLTIANITGTQTQAVCSVGGTITTLIGQQIANSISGTATSTFGLYINAQHGASSVTTNSYGIQVLAPTVTAGGSISSIININSGSIAGVVAGLHTATGINVAAISSALDGVSGAAAYGINVAAISSTNAAIASNNYGINIGAISGGVTSNFGLNIAAISSTSSVANYGLAIGAITGASANNFSLYTAGGQVRFVDSAARTAAFTAQFINNSCTSSTAAIGKIGLDIQSIGTWNGAGSTNTGLNVNATGGTVNYAAIFSGGNVGIGIAAPAVALDVNGSFQGAVDGGSSTITLYAYNATSNTNSNLIGWKARGTKAAPTAVLSGDRLFNLGAGGYTGAAFAGSSALIDFNATETWTATANGTSIVFTTTPNGSAYTARLPRMIIDHNGTVGIGTSTPNASSILDLTSTTQAFLPPRMTTTQKAAIVTPVAGMVVFDTTLAKLCVYGGAAWQTITSV